MEDDGHPTLTIGKEYEVIDVSRVDEIGVKDDDGHLHYFYKKDIPEFFTTEEENNTYTLVLWPESQEYMEKEWFQEEAHLCIDIDASYFIPTKYVK